MSTETARVDETQALDLRLVSMTADLDALQPAWSSLHQECGAIVFQSYEWQRTWWKHLGEPDPGRELHVIVLTEAGRVICIAPLQVERVPALGPLRLRRLGFMGGVLTDYLDVLIAKGFEDRCFDRIAAHLAAGPVPFDVISLGDIPDASPTRAGLLQALRRHGFEGDAFVSEQCPRTQLLATWKETLASFDGNHRRQLNKRCRQLQERFKVELEVCRREEDLAGDVQAFIQMHQHRWTSIGRKGVYAEPAVAAFQTEVSRLFFGRGWLYLSFLRVDGARISALCSFKHRDELAYYLNGTGEAGEAWKLSPGLVQHCLCMEDLVPQGVRVYDFLRGTERYKYECGAADVPNWTLQLFRGEARLARVRNAVALLRESLARRLDQERLAFDHQRKTHGLLSAEMVRHLWGRIRVTVRDGVTKLRAPEKSLTAERGPRT
jgi:CelD/BcsL family acetyltransferase involved in cellulose biosynthesis